MLAPMLTTLYSLRDIRDWVYMKISDTQLKITRLMSCKKGLKLKITLMGGFRDLLSSLRVLHLCCISVYVCSSVV